MATGKHIGKVLIKIRDEEINKNSTSMKRIINAIPRTYMNQEKSYILVGMEPTLNQFINIIFNCRESQK